MTATAIAGGDQICRGCQDKVTFIAEAFGSVCINCGTVIEDFRLDTGPFFFRANPSFDSNKCFQYGYGRLQQEARRLNNALHLEEYRQSRPESDGVIGAILARFGRSNLQREVQDLVEQVLKVHDHNSKAINTLQPLSDTLDDLNEAPSTQEDRAVERKKTHIRGQQAKSRLAVAATFSTMKKYNETITLEDVCNIANVASLGQIADCLQYMESLVGDTALLISSRDSPSMYIAAQINFLVKQIKLKPRGRLGSPFQLQDDESVLEIEEQCFVREASIDTPIFKKLAIDLCELCSSNGLNNRSFKISIGKDLVICAWAIMILALEASSGQICNQGKMAKAVVAFKNWQKGGSVELNAEDDVALQDTAARTATEEIVKKRYVEISRMLTMYLEQLPWLSDEKPGIKEKKASKSKGREKVAVIKQNLTSIQPFPRRIVAKYLSDVIKLRRSIEKRLLVADSERNYLRWSRFGSTEDQFHHIRASIDGQKRIKEEEWQHLSEQRSSIGAMSSYDGVLKAVHDLLLEENSSDIGQNQSSKLANCIGSTLLHFDSLRDMGNEVIDSLLFEKGEMDTYIRSNDEVNIVKALRVDKGDWDSSLTSNNIGLKRARSEEEQEQLDKINFIDGKRTKAMNEQEAARILSLLS